MGGFSTCNIFTGFGSVRLSFIPLKATMEDTHFANYEEVKKWIAKWIKSQKTVLSTRNPTSARKMEKDHI